MFCYQWKMSICNAETQNLPINGWSSMNPASFKLNRDLKLIVLSNLMGAVGEGLYFYIWSLYILELKADPIYLGALISILYFISAITPIPGGFLADKYDRKKVVIFAWMMWATTPLLYSMATDWTQILPQPTNQRGETTTNQRRTTVNNRISSFGYHPWTTME